MYCYYKQKTQYFWHKIINFHSQSNDEETNYMQRASRRHRECTKVRQSHYKVPT